jgi:hypothetical protein
MYQFVADAGSFGGPIFQGCHDALPYCQLYDLLNLANNLITFAVYFAVLVATALFTYAGILYVTASANQNYIEKAKKIFWAVLAGLVIVLASWLVIDIILSVLTGKGLSVWSSIPYVPPQNVPGGATGSLAGGHTGNGSTVECDNSNTSCGVPALEALGYTPAQANAMSCIAMTESGGNTLTPNSKTGACGTFQIVPSNWNKASLHQGNCGTATSCNDPTCNAQTAYLLSQQRSRAGQSPYGDWTCPSCNTNAQGCIDKYDPGN